MEKTFNKQAAVSLMLSGSLEDYIAYLKSVAAK